MTTKNPKNLSLFGCPVIVSDKVPDGEVHFHQFGEKIGGIVNIKKAKKPKKKAVQEAYWILRTIKSVSSHYGKRIEIKK